MNLNNTFDDELKIVLPASNIPDGAVVTKKTGAVKYTLKHKLVVYQNQTTDLNNPSPAINIDGYFLIGSQGSINQIPPETELIWVVNAEDFYIDLGEMLNGLYNDQ